MMLLDYNNLLQINKFDTGGLKEMPQNQEDKCIRSVNIPNYLILYLTVEETNYI